MKKDKEWLKAQVKDEERELKSVYDNYVPYEKVLIADDVNELIDQLDEPEITEEQAWNIIGEAYADSEKGNLMNAKRIFDRGLKMQGVNNTIAFELNKRNYKGTFDEFILDLIKQTELPVIPQFVADYIEKRKQGMHWLLGAVYGDILTDESFVEICEWCWKNTINHNSFASAYITGDYAIEKEKLYYVALPYIGYMTNDKDQPFVDYKEDSAKSTEQEIKTIDERYWVFAEEVTDNV